VPKPWELRLDVGKSTIGTVTNVTCMMSRTNNMSVFNALACAIIEGVLLNNFVDFTGADRICIGDT